MKGRGARLTGIWKGLLARQLFVWKRIWEPRPEARDESEWAWVPRVQAVPEAVPGAGMHQVTQTTPDKGWVQDQ